MSKKKKEVQVIEETKDEVVQVAKVAEPIIYEAVFKTGALRGDSFSYSSGSKNAIIGKTKTPVSIGLVTATALNPHGDTLQVNIAIDGSGSNVVALPRAEGEALISAINSARAANPSQTGVAGLVAGATSYVKKTVARKTGGCKTCGGRR